MRHARDRWIAGGALTALVVLAAAVVLLVLDAQHAGIETREDLRRDQVKQLANQMETLVQQAYTSLAGFYGAPGHFNMLPNDPADSEKLTPLDPSSNSGSL